MESRYAIVTVAILLPDEVETEAEMRAYLAQKLNTAGIECVTADDLPQDGERCH